MTGENVKVVKAKQQLREKIAELRRALAAAEQELEILERQNQKNYSWSYEKKPDDPIPRLGGRNENRMYRV